MMHKSCYTVYMESLIQNEEYYSYPIIRTYSYIPVSNLRHEYCKSIIHSDLLILGTLHVGSHVTSGNTVCR